MFTRQNGIRIFLLNTFLFTCLFFLTSCFAGLGDWTYELPNNYEVSRINSQSVVLEKNLDGLYDQVLDRFIIAFCYNKSYIGAQRVPMDDIRADYLSAVEEIDISKAEYYLIDTIEDICYGPYTKGEYISQCEKLDVETMCDWIKTIKYTTCDPNIYK